MVVVVTGTTRLCFHWGLFWFAMGFLFFVFLSLMSPWSVYLTVFSGGIAHYSSFFLYVCNFTVLFSKNSSGDEEDTKASSHVDYLVPNIELPNQESESLLSSHVMLCFVWRS